MEHWFVLDESHYFKDNYSSFFPLSHKSDAGPFNSYLFCQEEEYRAKSSRPYFGKTPTEVSKGFVRVRTAWFVSQFLLIIWSMIANTRAPHRVWCYRGTVADSVFFFCYNRENQCNATVKNTLFTQWPWNKMGCLGVLESVAVD